MVFNKLYRKDLNKEERQLYDRVKKLRYGEIIGFSMGNKNGTNSVFWEIYRETIDNIETLSLFGSSIHDNEKYSFIFVPEYDNYWSKFSNFDYMLIYVMNWYDNCIDEYIKIISRKNKLIEIKNKYY